MMNLLFDIKKISLLIALLCLCFPSESLASTIKNLNAYCAAAYFVESENIGSNKLGGMYAGYYLYFTDKLIKEVGYEKAKTLYKIYKANFEKDPYASVINAIIECKKHLPH